MSANIISARVLARLIKLSERRIQQLVKEGVLTRESNGKYPMVENIHRYIDYIGIRSRQQTDDELDQVDLNATYKKEKIRLTKAQADYEEIKAKLATNQVIDVAQLELALANVFGLIQSKLLVVPERVENELIGETDKDKFHKILLEEIKEAMYEVTDGTEETLQKIIGIDDAD